MIATILEKIVSTHVQRPYHHGDLRRSLIQAGSKMIEEKGLAGLSLREVARAAGVSHTAPYRHFQDKADLLAAIAQLGFEQLTDQAGKAASLHEGDPCKQFVAASVQYILFGVRNPCMSHLLFGGVINMRTAPRALKRSSWAAFQLVETIIDNGKRAGVFLDRDTMELAVATWSGIHGLAQLISGGYLSRLAATERQVEALGKMVCQLLLTGILNPDEKKKRRSGFKGSRIPGFE
ncbi:TetR/AcrR family transcriptional regulator [uncultured Desulfosarcina sp.]|uniref:TetR/AcrR family transcriptional regulator n=1 Tax=uncultured Desulfosarcina sp. TaxID=218289 RepID=UPI0029C811C3|nr:TetR/AcrR family transcriptional regulator [uncultured Desulfosarcina sp.]